MKTLCPIDFHVLMTFKNKALEMVAVPAKAHYHLVQGVLRCAIGAVKLYITSVHVDKASIGSGQLRFHIVAETSRPRLAVVFGIIEIHRRVG